MARTLATLPAGRRICSGVPGATPDWTWKSVCQTDLTSAVLTPIRRIIESTQWILVRGIDYRLKNVKRSRAVVSSDHYHTGPRADSRQRISPFYHERWEIETALDELKTHLRGAQIVLRSKTPELVKQGLSFVHSVHVVQRHMARYNAIPPSRNRINPRGVKRKMSNYRLRPRKRQRTKKIDVAGSGSSLK